jgi:hypothetical protein
MTPLEKAVDRIARVCDLMGNVREFDRLLPSLENFLEEQVARGIEDDNSLAVDGLCYLKTQMRDVDRAPRLRGVKRARVA